jgi:hypothetical protein
VVPLILHDDARNWWDLLALALSAFGVSYLLERQRVLAVARKTTADLTARSEEIETRMARAIEKEFHNG